MRRLSRATFPLFASVAATLGLCSRPLTGREVAETPEGTEATGTRNYPVLRIRKRSQRSCYGRNTTLFDKPSFATLTAEAESEGAVVRLILEAEGTRGMSSKTLNRCRRNGRRRIEELEWRSWVEKQETRDATKARALMPGRVFQQLRSLFL